MFYFTCPVCKAPLSEDEKSARCENGHCFDKGKTGYLNLLTNAKNPVGNHGDNKLMVRARKAFLNAGYYAPLQNKICDVIHRYAQKKWVLLDSGCGEGYYTNEISHSLMEKQVTVAGIDISKDAVICAGKGEHAVKYAVASSFGIPVGNESCDAVSAIFSPLCPEEFLRILKPHGILFLVAPLEKHLWCLKKAVYDHPYENTLSTPGIAGFEFLERVDVKDMICVDSGEDIQNLFTMTPYYYKTSEKDQKKLDALSRLETEIEFGIFISRKL